MSVTKRGSKRDRMNLIKTLTTLALTLALVHGAPTASSSSFQKLMQKGAEDVSEVINAKAAVVQYAGDQISASASAAGNAAVDFVASVDPIEITDDLEQSVIDSKVSAIHTVFDAKRNIIKAIQDAKDRHSAQFAAIFNASAQAVNQAVETTADGIVVTKSAVSDLAQNMTLENTIMAVSDAFNASVALIEDTVSGLVDSIVQAKETLHESGMNFDSKVVLKGTKETMGQALNVSVENAEILADKLGFFAAIDAVVKGLSQLPLKVNQVFSQVEEKLVEKLEEEAIEAEKEKSTVGVQITVDNDKVQLDFDQVNNDNGVIDLKRLKSDIKKAVTDQTNHGRIKPFQLSEYIAEFPAEEEEDDYEYSYLDLDWKNGKQKKKKKTPASSNKESTKETTTD